MVHIQDSISKHLHHHTFFNMLSDEIFEVHHAQILSCFSLGVCAWFIAQLIFPTLWLFSPIFSIVLQMWLGLPHFLIVGFLRCVCTHSIDLMGIHLLRCAHGNKHTRTHDAIHNTFAIIMWDCCKPNFGLATKVRDFKGVSWEWSPWITSHASGNIGGREGMNPHIPKWATTLGWSLNGFKVFKIMIARVKIHWIEKFIIPLERSWNGDA
jgi:hypothetical protein